jgi:hypothetical protein
MTNIFSRKIVVSRIQSWKAGNAYSQDKTFSFSEEVTASRGKHFPKNELKCEKLMIRQLRIKKWIVELMQSEGI